MPFVFGIFGILFIVAGVRGQTSNLVALIKSDFTGQPNYFEWMIAIFLTGAIGYIEELQTISRLFMVLLILGLVWEKRGIFSQFTSEETSTAGVNSTTSNASSALPSLSPLGQSVVGSPVGQSVLTSALPSLLSAIPE